MDILVIGEMHEEAARLLEGRFKINRISHEYFAGMDIFPETEAVIIRTFTKLGKEELKRLPNLKYVVSCSVGTDNIDTDALKAKGIEIVHCAGTNANSVAEHTIFLMLSLLRNGKNNFVELVGKTVGIIGFGHIGKAVARKLKGFGVKILAYDIVEQEKGLFDELGVNIKDFEYVISNSDILTIHLSLNSSTEKLINEKAFEKMKKGVFFINTSRAGVVDEEMLVKHNGRFGGIGLDVYSEWLKENLNGSNVILTDHTAALGRDSFLRMCVEPVEKFLRIIGLTEYKGKK